MNWSVIRSRNSKLHKDNACSDLGWNGSQLAPPSGCIVQNSVHTVRRGGTAVLCCLIVGHLEDCQLQSLVLGLSVNVRLHSTLKEKFKPPSAKRNRKCSNSLLKLSSYSDLDYQSMVRCFAHYLVSAVFDLAAVCNFVLLLTIWIRVSLMFDNINNVACGGPES